MSAPVMRLRAWDLGSSAPCGERTAVERVLAQRQVGEHEVARPHANALQLVTRHLHDVRAEELVQQAHHERLAHVASHRTCT